MFSFLLIPLLTLLTALLHTANASAVPAPATTDHLSNRSSATPSSASPSSPSPSSPSPTDSADPTDPTAIRSSPAQISAFVNAHNQVRAQHHANPLKWSVSFARLAEQWADACNFRHTNGVLSDEPYGENIVAATGNFTVNAAVGTFFQDESQYNPGHPVASHFTQVVWRSTTEVGCGVSICNGIFPGQGPATLYVCLYNPPGNIIGEFAQNVFV